MTLAGKTFRAIANSSHGTISTDTLCMHLDWQWLTGDQSGGVSEWMLESP